MLNKKASEKEYLGNAITHKYRKYIGILLLVFCCNTVKASISIDEGFYDLDLGVNIIETNFAITIKNNSTQELYVSSDYYSFGQFTVVVVLENGLNRKVLDIQPPPLGKHYLDLLPIAPKETITNTYIFGSLYPELESFGGTALIFWSTDLYATHELGSVRTKRFSGST